MFKKRKLQKFKTNFKNILNKHLTQQIYGDSDISDMDVALKHIQEQNHWYFIYKDGIFTVMTNKISVKFETYKPVFENAIAEIGLIPLKIYHIDKSIALCPSYRAVAVFKLNL